MNRGAAFAENRRAYRDWLNTATPRRADGTKTARDIDTQANRLTNRINDEYRRVVRNANRGRITMAQANERIEQLNRRHNRVSAASRRLSEAERARRDNASRGNQKARAAGGQG